MYSRRPKINDCDKCGGEGWLWGHELDDPSEQTRADTLTRYTCDACHARQRCGYCGAFHDPLQTLEQECIDAMPKITNEQIEAALEKGRRDRDIAEGRVPPPATITDIHASDLQRSYADALATVTAERDEARAQAAAMREAIQSFLTPCPQCAMGGGPFGCTCGDGIAELRAALASDAGRALVEELAAARKAQDAIARRANEVAEVLRAERDAERQRADANGAACDVAQANFHGALERIAELEALLQNVRDYLVSYGDAGTNAAKRAVALMDAALAATASPALPPPHPTDCATPEMEAERAAVFDAAVRMMRTTARPATATRCGATATRSRDLARVECMLEPDHYGEHVSDCGYWWSIHASGANASGSGDHLDTHSKTAADFPCSCERSPRNDEVTQWDPACKLHGAE